MTCPARRVQKEKIFAPPSMTVPTKTNITVKDKAMTISALTTGIWVMVSITVLVFFLE